MEKGFLDKICSIVGNDNISVDEPMKKHTTFRIGGPADYYVTPHSGEETAQVIEACREWKLPFYILGNGSNLLVSDRGFRGVIIQMFKNYSEIFVDGVCVTAKAGALLSKIAKTALENNLTGLEFAAGIPGTLGGAVVMNAGAYGGEMKDVLEGVTVLSGEGKILSLKREELELGYRTSVIARKGYIVLEAKMRLQEGSREAIASRMEELKEKRVSKQPLELPSAGSTFKRPEGNFAGKLIMEAGLRGFSVGGAQVSEKHCGFVVNKGGATAEQVRELMQEVVRRVEETSGVTLEPEVKMLGEW
ncbi:UDP-N-acetylmuramate dehydrogenase [Lachnospiraceae bacterium 46-15]